MPNFDMGEDEYPLKKYVVYILYRRLHLAHGLNRGLISHLVIIV